MCTPSPTSSHGSPLRFIDEREIKSTRRQFTQPGSPLTICASQQPSLTELKRTIATLPGKGVHVINLREETYVYINGFPVSKEDGKLLHSPEQIEEEEEELAHEIRKSPMVSPLYHRVKQKEGPSILEPLSPLFLDEKTEIFTERAVVTSQMPRARYIRVPIADHGFPDEKSIDKLVDDHDQRVAEAASLFVHCLGGKGRSSIVFLMEAILIKAKEGESLADIFTFVESLGNVSMTKQEEESSPKRERSNLAFWQDFYIFACEREEGLLWSNYLANHTSPNPSK